MITLEEYKKYLIEYYRYGIDGTKEKQMERKKCLERNYSDEALQTFIQDTYDFVSEMFEKHEGVWSYYKHALIYTTGFPITLNLAGGWMSDTIYSDLEERHISEHILKYIFGGNIHIDCVTETEEFEDAEDPNLVGIEYYHFLYLQDFPDNMLEIEQQIKKKNKNQKIKGMKQEVHMSIQKVKRIEEEINQLPIHEQLKILKSLSTQLKGFQENQNKECIQNGHQFGKWNFQVSTSRKLAKGEVPYESLQLKEEEWKRYCIRCGYLEKTNHQPIGAPDNTITNTKKQEENKPRPKMKKMYYDI